MQSKKDAIVLQNQNTKADLVQVTKDIATARSTVAARTAQLTEARKKLNQAKTQHKQKNLEYQICLRGLALLPGTNDGSCLAGNAFGGKNNKATGAVLGKDKNVIIVGNTKIYIGSCSQKQYAPGKNYFDINDKVEYEGIRNGNTVWAKTIKCTCAA